MTEWWREGVIYQIYPRSFQDSDGDGVGDLAGIESRLDHLVSLGVDAVWVSPIFPSPMADFGYDVSDYTGIHPLFGTMDDFDRLLAAAHARGLKLMLDFVPNHTSSAHPWFVEAASSQDNPKRDWYVWRSEPNNWQSSSGGSAWTWHEETGQYYLHKFLPQQPDLNWRNPAVREAMLGEMAFWFDRGIDGFRIDVLYHCLKDPDFRDDPPNPDYVEGRNPPFDAFHQVHSTDQPEIMDLVVGPMRALADRYGGKLLVGEIYLPVEKLARYHGPDGVHLPFNFSLIRAEWTAAELARLIVEYEASLPPDGWPNWVLGNHDQSRIATRAGANARAAAMMLLTLRGTPTIYYGDEIGMADVEIPPEAVRDPWEINMPGLGEGRDPCRTPMRWDGSEGRGFTDGEAWLPVGPESPNVAEQETDAGSMLNLHRALLKLRRDMPALSRGDLLDVRAKGDVLAYARQADGARLEMRLNFGTEDAPMPEGTFLLSTHGTAGAVLRAGEGVVLQS